MKTLFAILILISIRSAGLYAQGLEHGIKAGVNVANQDLTIWHTASHTKSKVLFHGGVFVTWMVSEKLGLQPEVLYSMQGSEFFWNGYERAFITNYINVPVLVRYNITDMYSVHAGPQFGFLVSGEEEFDGTTWEPTRYFNSTDFGIAFGLEANLPIKLGLGIRYILGMSNVFDPDGWFSGSELKNRVIQVYMKFRISKNTDD